jgi:hypothetical protein
VTTIRLDTAAGEMLAFALHAGTLPSQEGTSRVEFLFMGPPEKVELFDHPLGVFIQERKSVEFPSDVTRKGNHLEISILIDETASVDLSLQIDGTGSWRVRGPDDSGDVGICWIVKPKKSSAV